MYKNILQSIDNIAIWPLISFVIFFLFFIILLWTTFSAKKKFIDYMSNMPIDKTSANPTTTSHEK
jgi:cytochrome c oxidase cbb3-type subunit IV